MNATRLLIPQAASYGHFRPVGHQFANSTNPADKINAINFLSAPLGDPREASFYLQALTNCSPTMRTAAQQLRGVTLLPADQLKGRNPAVSNGEHGNILYLPANHPVKNGVRALLLGMATVAGFAHDFPRFEEPISPDIDTNLQGLLALYDLQSAMSLSFMVSAAAEMVEARSLPPELFADHVFTGTELTQYGILRDQGLLGLFQRIRAFLPTNQRVLLETNLKFKARFLATISQASRSAVPFPTFANAEGPMPRLRENFLDEYADYTRDHRTGLYSPSDPAKNRITNPGLAHALLMGTKNGTVSSIADVQGAMSSLEIACPEFWQELTKAGVPEIEIAKPSKGIFATAELSADNLINREPGRKLTKIIIPAGITPFKALSIIIFQLARQTIPAPIKTRGLERLPFLELSDEHTHQRHFEAALLRDYVWASTALFEWQRLLAQAGIEFTLTKKQQHLKDEIEKIGVWAVFERHDPNFFMSSADLASLIAQAEELAMGYSSPR
jgi:hypothetical protein